jgi:hypothetical protein
VAGVEDDTEDFRIGLGEKSIRLDRCLHPAGRVGVKDRAQPGLIPHRARDRFGATGVARPLVVGEGHLGSDAPGVKGAPRVGDIVVGKDDERSPATIAVRDDSGQQAGDAQRMLDAICQ